MTTLADINQTLMVQNEMQEKTTKAVDSLTKRFAVFLRVSKGDKLEDLESRREARRQNRASGFARGVSGFAKTAKENAGLISKILGGLALGAFVLQNDELRGAVMDFITTAGEGIATFFKSDEFREILGATFSAAGNVFTSILGTVWETDGGKKMLIGLGVALAAIFAGPAVIAAIAGAITAATLRAAGKALFPTGGGRGNIVEKRGERAKALQQQRVVGQGAKKLTPGRVLGTATKVLGAVGLGASAYMGAADKELQEEGMLAGERMFTGVLQGAASIPDVVLGLTNFAGVTDTDFSASQATRQAMIDISNTAQRMQKEEYGAAKGTPEAAQIVDSLLNRLERGEQLSAMELKIIKNLGFSRDQGRMNSALRNNTQPVTPRRTTNPQPAFYLDRIIRMINKSYTPPAKSSLEYDNLMRQHLMFMESTDADLQSSIRTKLGALKQGIESTGVATIALAPMIISGQSGKGSNTTQAPNTTIVPNVASAGETNHISFGHSGEQVVYGLPRIGIAT